MDTAGTTDSQEKRELYTKYRRMQGDHKSYAEETQKIVRQQKMLIEGLTYENQILETRLAHETQASKSHSSKDGLQRVSKLRKNKQDLLAQISALGDDVSHHRQMLKDFLGRLNELRKRKSRVSGRKVTDGALERKRKILEGRLEQAITSLNKKLANTKVLRETIENLRKERSFFDRSIRKLQYEEDSTQKRIDEAIDGSNSAYAHREQL
ncbi:Outer Dynein Arm Docking Complex, partial [Aduncisulcus paluster]